MSETNTTNANDAAIDVLRERVRQLDIDIAMHKARMDGATMVRDDYLDTIATLSRKPRPRKPRPVTEAAPGPAEDAPRPTVFAMVQPAANDEAGDVAGEAA
jgi:hypothetical protein